jgi:hypothetical protein
MTAEQIAEIRARCEPLLPAQSFYVFEVLPLLDALAESERRAQEASGNALEMAAQLSFICGQDTDDTERNARAALVQRLAESERQREAIRVAAQAVVTAWDGDDSGTFVEHLPALRTALSTVQVQEQP